MKAAAGGILRGSTGYRRLLYVIGNVAPYDIKTLREDAKRCADCVSIPKTLCYSLYRRQEPGADVAKILPFSAVFRTGRQRPRPIVICMKTFILPSYAALPQADDAGSKEEKAVWVKFRSR